MKSKIKKSQRPLLWIWCYDLWHDLNYQVRQFHKFKMQQKVIMINRTRTHLSWLSALKKKKTRLGFIYVLSLFDKGNCQARTMKVKVLLMKCKTYYLFWLYCISFNKCNLTFNNCFMSVFRRLSKRQHSGLCNDCLNIYMKLLN